MEKYEVKKQRRSQKCRVKTGNQSKQRPQTLTCPSCGRAMASITRTNFEQHKKSCIKEKRSKKNRTPILRQTPEYVSPMPKGATISNDLKSLEALIQETPMGTHPDIAAVLLNPIELDDLNLQNLTKILGFGTSRKEGGLVISISDDSEDD